MTHFTESKEEYVAVSVIPCFPMCFSLARLQQETVSNRIQSALNREKGFVDSQDLMKDGNTDVVRIELKDKQKRHDSTSFSSSCRSSL